MTERATQPTEYRWTPNTPVAPDFELWNLYSQLIASSSQTWLNPEGRTASTYKGEKDEWSDENLRMWEEEDKLDPELAEWLKAQLGR